MASRFPGRKAGGARRRAPLHLTAGSKPCLVYFIYSFLMGLVAFLLTPYWLVQGLRHGKYLSNLGNDLDFRSRTCQAAA